MTWSALSCVGSEMNAASPARSLALSEQGVSRSFERTASPRSAGPWQRGRLAAVVEAASEASASERTAAAAERARTQGTTCSNTNVADFSRSEAADSDHVDLQFPSVFQGPLGSARWGSVSENVLPESGNLQNDLAVEVRGLIQRLHAIERTLQQQRQQQEVRRA